LRGEGRKHKKEGRRKRALRPFTARFQRGKKKETHAERLGQAGAHKKKRGEKTEQRKGNRRRTASLPKKKKSRYADHLIKTWRKECRGEEKGKKKRGEGKKPCRLCSLPLNGGRTAQQQVRAKKKKLWGKRRTNELHVLVERRRGWPAKIAHHHHRTVKKNNIKSTGEKKG